MKSEIKISSILSCSALLILLSSGGVSCARAAASSQTDVSITRGPNGLTTVKEQSSLELPCVYQLPDVYRQSNSVILRWRKDNKTLRQWELGQVSGTNHEPQLETMVREDARIALNKETGSLHFGSVLASDAGVYQCQLLVEGQSPVSSGSGSLEVIEQLKFMPQPTSKNLELGSVSKVHCKAQGTPTPQVKWMRETQLPLPQNVSDHNGTLIFRGVSNEQRGQYTCVASNSQGQISATVAINVVVAPKFSVPPVGPIEVSEEDIAVMHCQATGEPKPTIRWDKDLTYLNENNTDPARFRLLENGTLEIRNVQAEDEGNYGCTIGSSAGLKREEVLLVVRSNKSASNSIVTRIIIVIICLAFLYFVLVLGLKLWYRYRRHMGKVQLEDGAHAAAIDGHEGDHHDHAEHEPCLTEANNSSKNLKSKLRESTILEQESQVADDIV
ncbi:tyrosine-protein kinase-like otk isoform X2 [Drosophila grimshawi]|uniref:GH21046 n=1 Tax=Drosophila grimshawi TaxID=7222 RepID=B4J5H2_DROGR|nr:tyrosine-protein kinase-like otk isoform X2 [Drosophila grimshawi]EDW00735.1 GH21046 [Drosophila grimshawi]